MVLILIMKKINSEKINYQILNRMIIVKALREITIKKNYFWLWHKWKLFIEHLHQPQRVAKRGVGVGETDPSAHEFQKNSRVTCTLNTLNGNSCIMNFKGNLISQLTTPLYRRHLLSLDLITRYV